MTRFFVFFFYRFLCIKVVFERLKNCKGFCVVFGSFFGGLWWRCETALVPYISELSSLLMFLSMFLFYVLSIKMIAFDKLHYLLKECKFSLIVSPV